MKIVKASDRLKSKHGIKGVIFGPFKIGKTSLLWTLDPEKTLFIDMEAGGLSVDGWGGDSIEINDWRDARNLACLIGGPNKSLRDNEIYSQAHYDSLDKSIDLSKYETIFIDSITQASRLALHWSKGQPQAISEKTGKPDIRGAYGLLGQEMVSWCNQIQHISEKNIWFVGLLDKKLDDFNRPVWVPQVEGQKTALELPGIVDQVITMAEISNNENDKTYRAFICNRPNPWGYPAGDRSGKLDMIEEPHLGRLMEKIRIGKRKVELTYKIESEETKNDEL